MQTGRKFVIDPTRHSMPSEAEGNLKSILEEKEKAASLRGAL